ncbi:uncharacterized protein [Typha latifolia]|uniref:uncharacterized protein n=1 Tax=Typha latifolia TaxID=4733 RepID=UPI003C2B405D
MATRSPSPNPTRPSTPLEPKTPKAMSSIRKNIVFNTSKASNPSDSPHKNSASKIGAAPQSLRSSLELKENERDPNVSKQARARSPAMPASKCAKNFMAPTVSASFKAIAASPRRKVLGERNKIVRSSLTSVSDPLESPVMEEIVSKSEVCLASRAPSSAPKASMISSEGVGMEEIGPKTELGFRYQDKPNGTESRKLSLEFKNHDSVVDHSFSSPLDIAPLDADPSLPPYDPKTNYLSPRPQFLHYRLNPRIEQYITGESDMLEIGDGKRLEDSFSTESCEDSPGYTEEGPTSSSHKDSEKESLCSVVEESIPQTLSQSHRSHTNSRFSLRFIFASFSLILFIVFLCIPLLDSPTISSSSILKSLALHTFPKLYIIKDFVVLNLNLKELANRTKHWPIKSFANYYASIVSTQREEYGPYYVANLTASLADQAVGIISYIDVMPHQEYISRDSEVEQEVKENIEEGSTIGYEMEDRSEVEAPKSGEIVEVEEEQAKIQTEVEIEKVKEDGAVLESGKIDMKVQEEVNEHDSLPVEDKISDDCFKEMVEEESLNRNEVLVEASNVHMEISHEFVSEPEKVEQQEDVGTSNSLSETQPTGFEEDHIDGREENPTFAGLKLEGLISNGLEGKILTQVAAGAALVAIALAATLVFLYRKRKQTFVIKNEKMLAEKLISGLVLGGSESYLHPRESHYQNSPIYIEMMGDSGPLALSSSLNNNSFSSSRSQSSRKVKEEDTLSSSLNNNSFSSSRSQRSRKVKEEDTLSHEKRLRRESAVFSSTSYGSFTTYEKISAKKGNREDEAMTPIRRSSRIRNLVTSP